MAHRDVTARAGGYLATLVLAVFVALLPSLGQPAHADTGDDSLLVYCLSPARRTGLLDAAAALGLAHRDNAGTYVLSDNTPLDPVSWQRDHRDDFVRTCKALFAAQRTPEPDASSSLLPFLTALSGAVLAFGAASWRDRVTRSHALADGLRSAFSGYSEAVEAYLDGSRINRTNTQVVERGYGLMLELAKAKAAYRKWPVVAGVEAGIERRQIGRTGQEDPDAGEVREWLKSTRDAVFGIANALEHPLLRNRAMRATPAGDA